MTLDEFQRMVLTSLVSKIMEVPYKDITLQDINTVKGILIDDQYRQWDNFLKKQLDKGNLNLEHYKTSNQVKINETVNKLKVLTLSQKGKLETEITQALDGTRFAGTTIKKLDVQKKLMNNVLNKGLSFVNVGTNKWDVFNFIRVYQDNIIQNMYQDMSMGANNQIGNSVMLVSRHSGAREKCYPYQDWLVDMNNSLNGVQPTGELVRPISATSYGQVDGLRGKNCRHQLIPFILGINKKIKSNIPPSIEQNELLEGARNLTKNYEREIRKVDTLVHYAGTDVEKQFYKDKRKELTTRLDDHCKRFNIKRNYQDERGYY